MSDSVHYIPGARMVTFDTRRIRSIPCGVGKRKWRDLTASTEPKDVTCSRCLAALHGKGAPR